MRQFLSASCPIALLAIICLVAEQADGKKLNKLREASDIVIVPPGVHVSSYFPPCGVYSNVAEQLNNPAIIASVGEAFGPHAAATVIVVGQAATLSRQHGGEIAKTIRRFGGHGDVASCATFCVRAPKGAKPKSITLSTAGGVTMKTLKWKDGSVGDNVFVGGWSGWRAVTTATANGRPLVCGTAVHWTEAGSATMRMAIQY
ncbi:UNVERIFIED_ORG: hypothetical protein ABIC62_006678 [Burkholderia sp. 1595]|uniref:Uncharacterized protein n=1 Tax=Paraburkholderia terricola TaxID=169427 RepID=A0ABU1M2J5_9BURK|nr:hypothetical protein [Paraburkholderia terricola]MDR6413243.1 hypothetical protein [Paraburkholderia terricola]